MKIAYITRARMPTEKAHGLQIAKMCEAYAGLGHEVELVVPFRRNEITDDVSTYYGLREKFTVTTVPIPDTIRFAQWVPFFAYWGQALLFILALAKRDILRDTVIMTRSADIAFWYGRRGYRVICEVHDLSRTRAWWTAFLLRKATLIICNSHGVEEALRSRGLSRIMTAPNAVDLEAVSANRGKEEMRALLGIPQDAFVPMYIGALEAWKGYQIFLDAVKEVSSLSAVVIGGKEGHVKELQGRYPQVHFLGQRPYREIGDNQSCADVLVVPNDPAFKDDQAFTSPIKLFAHMASGIPIVVTDLPSIRTIVGDNQVFFFDGSAESLRDTLAFVRTHPEVAKEKAAAAKERVLEFTWKKRAGTVLKEIEEGRSGVV